MPTWLHHRFSAQTSGWQSHLVGALEVEKRSLERAARDKAKSKVLAAKQNERGGDCGDFIAADEERSPPGLVEEQLCLRSTTMKYVRGSIGAGQFYEEMVREGRVEEAVIVKVARGMPEDKAWALMDAHRKWRHEERLNKKRFRASRRAETIGRRRAKNEDALADSEGGDDRCVAFGGPTVLYGWLGIVRIHSPSTGQVSFLGLVMTHRGDTYEFIYKWIREATVNTEWKVGNCPQMLLKSTDQAPGHTDPSSVFHTQTVILVTRLQMDAHQLLSVPL